MAEPSMIVVVMGVSGAGKSTVGRALADSLGARFIEGDDFHSQENRAKMQCGVPLDDADRQGWLAGLAQELAVTRKRGESAVLACSALKQAYRDLLAASCPDLHIVWLSGDRDLVARRLAARTDHFMPAGLLDSQFAILEPPACAVTVDIDSSPQDIVAQISRLLTKYGQA